jgi:hypothetical protein
VLTVVYLRLLFACPTCEIGGIVIAEVTPAFTVSC